MYGQGFPPEGAGGNSRFLLENTAEVFRIGVAALEGDLFDP